MFREDDGNFTLGSGRIKIASDDPLFVNDVVGDINQLVHSSAGEELLRHGDAVGHQLKIVKPEPPTEPPNGWVMAGDIAIPLTSSALVARVQPTDPRMACRTIFYDPADWPRRGDSRSPSSAEILLRLLRLANEDPPAGERAAVTQKDQIDSTMTDDNNLVMRCDPAKAGNSLIFSYVLENYGRTEVLAMHALPSVDKESGEARANEVTPIVIADVAGDAIVGKFAVPLPVDRRVALPVLPLARRLAPGAHLEGRVEVSLPLTEKSPYLPDLTPHEHEPVNISGIVFMIGYWPTGIDDGFFVVPADYSSDLLIVEETHPLGSARNTSRRFPTRGLQLLKRKDH